MLGKWQQSRLWGTENQMLSENTGETFNKHPALTYIDYLEMLFTILLQSTSMSCDLQPGYIMVFTSLI